MDRDEEGNLLLVMYVTGLQDQACPFDVMGRGNAVFKYSSQSVIIDCLNPLASVQKQLIKANPG